MFKIVSFFFLLIPVLCAAGEVKKWVDKEGVVHFGDTPPVATDYELTSIRPLTGGKGLSTKQVKLAKELERRVQKEQKSKFRAEKVTAKRYRAQQKIEAAYRKRKLVKGLSEQQIKRLLGEPDSVDQKESKKGLRQIWHYESVRAGEPQVVTLENGFYRSHRNKKIEK